jgi:hypothetical protein
LIRGQSKNPGSTFTRVLTVLSCGIQVAVMVLSARQAMP